MGRAGLAAAARGLATAIPTYPVEAAVALSNSMQADELDDRCCQPTHHARAGASACGGETADAEACAAARAACRHSSGALFLCYNLPRYKPAVPWGPEAASRLLEATVAAVRRNILASHPRPARMPMRRVQLA